ncbi:CPBP family intramembrane metalloprotease domain-containing protein [Leptospira perolatii]|uniref:CPBP family intramembrane metalloprotease domain-containing protein n=1 Tax=Leptospira perolatii TaxID=2023191 RepID=A0A2M9ZRU8_9LEPT|nr:type II CAAX endopeptidase family protein [Leptospira perolatii]PJZ71168.1 CPBP family intramembrane metalloprotease domain-containing protein [Leptospira perolatii]PJZ74701.1 CPBP family intramembrane metalloprotease domain-containing protein [Leptospira perolatii]
MSKFEPSVKTNNFWGEISGILFMQSVALLASYLLYQQVARLYVEISISDSSASALVSEDKKAARSKSTRVLKKETVELNDVQEKAKASAEKKSLDTIVRDYTNLVVTRKPWLLIGDRVVWAFCFILPALLIIRKLGKVEIADLRNKANWKILSSGLLVGIATFSFVNVVGGITFYFVGKPQPNPLELALTQHLRGNWALLGWSFLGISVGAGLVEEIFFRGILLKQFIGKQMEWIGLVITSVLFGLIHYNPGGSWIGPILLISVGFFFGLSYAKTENIWVPITAHLTYNSCMLIAAFFLGDRVV